MAEDVAERGAGIRGAVLGNRLLLLGHFECLDRELHLGGAAVEQDDAGIDLLADLEAVGTLVVAVAGELRTLDEGGQIPANDLHVDAGLLDLGDLGGDDVALLHVGGGRHRVALELLDAERDALLLDIDVQHLGLDLVALLVLLDDLLARTLPVEIGEMDHAVHIAVEAEEQTELGLVLDLAFDRGARRVLLDEDFPRIAHGLLEAERDAALDRVDFENLHFDLLRGRDDLARMDVLLGPRHFGDVDQAFDARLQFDERAVVGDVGDAAFEPRADRELDLDALPRIVQQLLHAERDAVGLVVDLDDLDLHRLTDVEHFGRVIDSAPRDIGNVQQAVDAAQVHERAVVGDVLDHAVDHLTLFEVLHQLLALLGAGLFEDRAARHHDVAAAAIHLQDLERLVDVHQWGDVADRPDVDLRARQERHRAVKIDGEAALDLVEDHAGDLLVVLECGLELAPALLAARLVARQYRLAERILDALQIDFDGVADLDLVSTARALEFTERDAPLGLQADVDDREVLLDADDGPLDDGPFRQIAAAEGLFEQGGEVFARWRGSSSNGHTVSKAVRRRVDLRAFRTRGLWAPQGPTATAGNRQAGAQPSVRNDGSESGAPRRGSKRGLVLQPRGACKPHLGPLGRATSKCGGPDGLGYSRCRTAGQGRDRFQATSDRKTALPGR